MRAQDVIAALDALEEELLSQARVEEGVAGRWPAGTQERRAREERAGAYRDAATRVWRLKTTGQLAGLLAEDDAAHYELRSISTRPPEPCHPDFARKGYW